MTDYLLINISATAYKYKQPPRCRAVEKEFLLRMKIFPATASCGSQATSFITKSGSQSQRISDYKNTSKSRVIFTFPFSFKLVNMTMVVDPSCQSMHQKSLKVTGRGPVKREQKYKRTNSEIVARFQQQRQQQQQQVFFSGCAS